MTSVQAYNLYKKPLRYLSSDVVAYAFLHTEARKFDKSGYISFNSCKYEVDLHYVGRTMDVVFDRQKNRRADH